HPPLAQRLQQELLLGAQHGDREQYLGCGHVHSPQSSSTSGARSRRTDSGAPPMTSCSCPQAVHSTISPLFQSASGSMAVSQTRHWGVVMVFGIVSFLFFSDRPGGCREV